MGRDTVGRQLATSQTKRIQVAHLDSLRMRVALIEQQRAKAAQLEQEARAKQQEALAAQMIADQLAESLTAYLASEYHINPRQQWHLDLERLQLVRRDSPQAQE